MSSMHDKARVIVDRGDLAVLVRWAQPITGNKNAQAAIAAAARYLRGQAAAAQTDTSKGGSGHADPNPGR
jgi:hypothetical protein